MKEEGRPSKDRWRDTSAYPTERSLIPTNKQNKTRQKWWTIQAVVFGRRWPAGRGTLARQATRSCRGYLGSLPGRLPVTASPQKHVQRLLEKGANIDFRTLGWATAIPQGRKAQTEPYTHTHIHMKENGGFVSWGVGQHNMARANTPLPVVVRPLPIILQLQITVLNRVV